MKNKKLYIVYILFLSTLSSQNAWYQGNLKGINDLSFELNIKGLKDDVWEKRVKSYIELKLLQQDIRLLDALVPRMALDINIIDSRVEEISSFLVKLSIYGYNISETEYYKSFSESKITKNLMTTKIFSYEVMGQTDSEKLYKDIEKNIDYSISLFLNNWYNDNPTKQF
ncbi:MAG: hypothetical protein CMF94_03415 [Candidatus Marinimicrobia bacterium]|nr:hypothetical protein [Candidatus Neomarinimicrobiota bacterium]